MRLYSFLVASVIAAPWTLVHMERQSHRSGSIGVGALVYPLAYPLAFASFLALLWLPALAFTCCARAADRAQLQSNARKLAPTFAALLIPYFICLWLLMTQPAMAAYRVLALILMSCGFCAAIICGIRAFRAPLAPRCKTERHSSDPHYEY